MGFDDLMDYDEYNARYAGRLFGLYAGVVKDIDDPEKLGRVRAIVPNVYGEDLSPWCTACFPTALGVDTGSVSIPPIDSFVWVTFEEGDVESPIYLGGFAVSMQNGRPSDGSAIEDYDEHQFNESPLIVHAQGLPDGSDTQGAIRGYRNIPPTGYRGEYGKVHVTRTPAGHVFEMNDTDGSSRVFLLHGASGAYYEIRDDGTIVEATPAKKRTIDKGVYAIHEGRSTEIYDSKVTRSFGGDYAESFLGNYKASFGDSSVEIDGGQVTAELEGIVLNANGSINIDTTGDVSLYASGGVQYANGGGRVDIVGGSYYLSASNALDPSGASESITMLGSNGVVSIRSTDATGLTAKGMEAWGVNDVYLGDMFTVPQPVRRSLVAVPLQKEGVVMSTQLSIALAELIGYFGAYASVLSSGGSTPGFGAPNPVLAAANITLSTQLAQWATRYTVPTGTKLQPMFASDSVFVSK